MFYVPLVPILLFFLYSQTDLVVNMTFLFGVSSLKIVEFMGKFSPKKSCFLHIPGFYKQFPNIDRPVTVLLFDLEC